MAAVSDAGICNQALSGLGADTITSLDDESTNGNYCLAMYDRTRDALVRSHPWNFAITRAELSVLDAAPEYGWSYQFTLPTSPYCLRVLELYGDYPFRVEGRVLLTNQDECLIRYIGRVTDPTKFDFLFIEAFVVALQIKLAIPLGRSKALRDELAGDFKSAILTAKGENAIESKDDDQDQSETDLWIDAGR